MCSLKILYKFSGLWIPFYSIMGHNEHKQLCESFRTATAFIGTDVKNDEEKLKDILFFIRERFRDLLFEINSIPYNDYEDSIPSLACIFGQSKFHLIKNLNYNFYVVIAEKNDISPLMLLGILWEPLSVAVIEHNSLQQFKDVFKKKNPGKKAKPFSFYLHLSLCFCWNSNIYIYKIIF